VKKLFYQIELRDKVVRSWERGIWHTMQFERKGEVSKMQMAGNMKKKMLTLTACTVCKGKKKGSRLKKEKKKKKRK